MAAGGVAVALSLASAGPAHACETLVQCTVETVQARVAEVVETVESLPATIQQKVDETKAQVDAAVAQAIADAQAAVADAQATVAESQQLVNDTVTAVDRSIAGDTWSCVLEGRSTAIGAITVGGPATCHRLDRDGVRDGDDDSGVRSGRFSLTAYATPALACVAGAGTGSLSITLSGDSEPIVNRPVQLLLVDGDGVIWDGGSAADGFGAGVATFTPTRTLNGGSPLTNCMYAYGDYFFEGTYTLVKPLPVSTPSLG